MSSGEIEFGANDRLTDLIFGQSIGRSTPDVEHERAVAIFDVLEKNNFRPVGDDVVECGEDLVDNVHMIESRCSWNLSHVECLQFSQKWPNECAKLTNSCKHAQN